MASFPVRWWRAVLALVQFKHDAANAGWVTPSNEITRAIFSGREIVLGTRPAAMAIAAPEPVAEVFVPAASVLVESAATVSHEAEAVAQTEQPAGEKRPRRAGRAA